MRTQPSFRELLAAVRTVDDLRPLLSQFGFGQHWTPLSSEHWPDPLSDIDLLGLTLAGERGGLRALVLQADTLGNAVIARAARRLRAHNPAQLWFFLFCDRSLEQLAFAAFGASEDLRILFLETRAPRSTDIEALTELIPRSGEVGLTLALRQARVLDRSRVTHSFFLDFKAQRNAIAASWCGLQRASASDRAQLALLFLCRLMFLYFLQRRGHLASDPEYLQSHWSAWQRRTHRSTFFRARLQPLFFGVLNTRPEKRTGSARRFGDLPYLNGGLFERHALERRQRTLDLPDTITAAAFSDLLQRYRFTTQDSAHAALSRTIDAGVDPEMLGRVFEELMAEAQRGDTGTFFTPPAVVDRLVGHALQALERHDLRELRVLDPACGSGAFLLGALGRIAALRARREGGSPDQYKRELVEQTLHGVDLQDDAALLCALRLWLCLLPSRPEADAVQPLPNLDRRIRQGDALTDPLDLASASVGNNDVSRAVAASAHVRATLKALRPLAQAYVSAEPHEKEPLRRQLKQLETQLARAWLTTARQRLAHAAAEHRALLAEVDLFGETTGRANAARGALERIADQAGQLARLQRQLSQTRAVPFFSFEVHFADSAPHGFDLIVSNPPWVRAHRWPSALGHTMRQRYEVCRSAGWKAADTENGQPGAQVDLSLLFLERATHLLAPRGVFALLLPAKTFRSLYAGGARSLLLRDTRIARLEDYSLDQRAIFRADAFTAAVVAVKDARSDAPVRVVCHQRHGPPLDFELHPGDLPLAPGETAAPWLLVPPEVGGALRQMQSCGATVGARTELPVHRGVFTGANEVLLVDRVEPKLGDLAWIRAAGFAHTPEGQARSRYRALIEDAPLRPIVRGASIGAWRFDPEGWLIWAHDEQGRSTPLPKRTQRYLERHAERLAARRAWQIGQSLGRVFSIGAHTTQAKVAWRDIAPTLQAALLPAAIRSVGRVRALIPLNTVYYITPGDERAALILCAYLNSLPVRTFARAVAERAKDAHFRFFAWTIRQLPLPEYWSDGDFSDRLLDIARAASHARACTTAQQREINALVAQAYQLTAAQIEALTRYQQWLDQAQMTGPRKRNE